MDEIPVFKRVIKQFAKGVAYRLVADAAKDGAKKLHERYDSTKCKNEKDNGGVELKKEDTIHHDGDGPSMINNEDRSTSRLKPPMMMIYS